MIKALLVVILFLHSAWACKPRHESSLSSDGRVPETENRTIRPADLAMLFPIDWTKDPRSQLVSLSALMDDSGYAALLSGITNFPGDDARRSSSRNPFSAAQAITSIPISEWYITGLRFIPCSLPDWPIPATMFSEVQGPSETSIFITVCRPAIRVSVQRFGTLGGIPIADDKSIHLVYIYHGGDTNFGSAILAGEKAFGQSLRETNGVIDGPTLKLRVMQRYTKDTAAQLKSVRKRFLQDVVSQLALSDGAKLKIGGLSPQAIAAYKNFILAKLPSIARIERVRINFAATAAIETAKRWILLSLEPRPSASAAMDVEKLVFPSSPVGNSFSLVSSGRMESFDNRPGSRLAIDRELAKSITDLNGPDAKLRTFAKTGFIRFGKIDNGRIKGNKNPDPAKVQRVYNFIHSSSLESPTSNCMSCHLGPFLRQSGAIPAESVTAVGPDNFDLSKLGVNPGDFAAEQNNLSGAWVLRQLGYFGQIPCIGDRLVFETERDAALANQLIATSIQTTSEAIGKPDL